MPRVYTVGSFFCGNLRHARFKSSIVHSHFRSSAKRTMGITKTAALETVLYEADIVNALTRCTLAIFHFSVFNVSGLISAPYTSVHWG